MSYVWAGRALVCIVAGIAMIFLGLFLSVQSDPGYNQKSTSHINALAPGSTVKVYGIITDSSDHASPVIWIDGSSNHRYKEWFTLNDTTGEARIRMIGTVEVSDSYTYNIHDKVAVVGKVTSNENGTKIIDAKAVAAGTNDFYGTSDPKLFLYVQIGLFLFGPLLIIWGCYLLRQLNKGADLDYNRASPFDNIPQSPQLPMGSPPPNNQWRPPPQPGNQWGPPPPPPGPRGPV
jgi:hypothetical protein